MIPAKRVFPMAKRKKGLDLVQQQEDQPKPSRKNRVSSLLKRFVSRSGDSHPAVNDAHPHHLPPPPHTAMSRKQRKKHLLRKLKRDASLHSLSSSHHPLPEILRVTPMGTSCEVTLLSSVEDGPGLYQITVTQNDGKSVVDHSYHTILNPHRTSKRHLFEDDDEDDYDDDYEYDCEYEVGSNESTHDVTTDASSPERSFAVDVEETIYFVGTEDEVTRDRRQDARVRKDPPVCYKSLFDDSEDEDGKEEDDEEYEDDLDENRSYERRRRRDGYDYWENYYQSWRQNAVIDHESYHYNVLTTQTPKTESTLQQQKQLLNTTLETIPIQYEEEEEEDDPEDQTVSTRDTDLPFEITVRLKPRKNT